MTSNTTPRMPLFGSLPLRVALFFAVNPDEELTTIDISVKFDADPREVTGRLQQLVNQGILARSTDGPGRGKAAVYRIGTVLMHMVGSATQREMIAACMPMQFSGHIRITAVPLAEVAQV
jgi:hypothetical protein